MYGKDLNKNFLYGCAFMYSLRFDESEKEEVELMDTAYIGLDSNSRALTATKAISRPGIRDSLTKIVELSTLTSIQSRGYG